MEGIECQKSLPIQESEETRVWGGNPYSLAIVAEAEQFKAEQFYFSLPTHNPKGKIAMKEA